MTEAAPAGTTAPATTPTPATPPATAPVATPPAGDPAWLPERLTRAAESARAGLLRELGVDDPAKAKAAIEAAAKAAEAEKSAETRAAETAAQLAQRTAEADRFKAIAAEHAGRMMLVLTPEQQAAVKAVAGDDPAQQLKTIGALAPTWNAAPAPAVKTDAPTPPPANTAPAATAPPAVSPGAAPDHQQNYQSLQKTNIFAAAAYGLAHQTEVYKPKS